MKIMNTPTSTSVRAETAIPNAWLTLLSESSGSRRTREASAAVPPESTVDWSAVSTSRYAAATFAVLHHALQAVQVTQGGPHLDPLASTLQRLFCHCNDNAAYLDRVKLERNGHLLTVVLLRVETQRARALADAVHEVLTFVRGRALGDLDQQELIASWRSLWNAATLPTRKSTSD